MDVLHRGLADGVLITAVPNRAGVAQPPRIELIGEVITNECHMPFADPGVSVSDAPIAIAAGAAHALALKANGQIAGWGLDAAQLDALRRCGSQLSRDSARSRPLGLQGPGPGERSRSELARVHVGEVHRSDLPASAQVTLETPRSSGPHISRRHAMIFEHRPARLALRNPAVALLRSPNLCRANAGGISRGWIGRRKKRVAS